MEIAIDKFLKNKAVGWSPRTIRQYKFYLERLAGWMTVQEIELEDIKEIDLLQWLQSHTTWGTASKYLAVCSIKAFFRYHFGRGGSQAEGLIAPRRVVKPQRTLTATQVEKLLSSFDTSKKRGIRNLALVTLMLDTGLRAIEVCRLRKDHLDLESKYLYVEMKGSHWGKGVFGSYTANALATWMPIRHKIAKPHVRTVFVALGGQNVGYPHNRHGLRTIFRYMGHHAGIGLISPHDMRRTFATMALRNGAPSRLVQIAGRWASLNMVERYSQALTAADFEPFSPVNHAMGLTE